MKRQLTRAIHDYFFAKSLEKLRPGGVMALITSRYTMDKQADTIRRHLDEHADLLGAIRLPNTAFKANAGTEVTTDILFLRKRGPGAPPAGQAWRGLETIDGPDGPIAVNECPPGAPGVSGRAGSSSQRVPSGKRSNAPLRRHSSWRKVRCLNRELLRPHRISDGPGFFVL